MHVPDAALSPAPLTACSVPNECPQEVLLLLRRCLDPDPSARPTATELVQLLQLAPAAPPAGSAAAAATLARRSFGGPGEGRPPMLRAGTGSGSLGMPSPSRAASAALPLPSQPESGEEPVASVRHSGNWGAPGLPAGTGAPSIATPEGTLGELSPLRPSLETNPPTSGPTTAGSGGPAAAGAGAALPPPT